MGTPSNQQLVKWRSTFVSIALVLAATNVFAQTVALG